MTAGGYGFGPGFAFSESLPEPSPEREEFGIVWNDGAFNGPFVTVEAAQRFARDVAPNRTHSIVARVVEASPWTTVEAS